MKPTKDFLEQEFRKEMSEHRMLVKNRMTVTAQEIAARGRRHDNSALDSSEKEILARESYYLKTNSPDGSAYIEAINRAQVAIFHHWRENDHHPEHFNKGIQEMNMLQLIEWISDAQARCLRESEDIYEYFARCKVKYGIDDVLYGIIIRTSDEIHRLLR